MDLPPNILDKIIKPGCIFYFREEAFSSQEPHYFCVLNSSRDNQTAILMVCCQSNVEKRIRARKNFPDTLVIVDESDLPFLDRKSVFDCNSVIIKSIDEVKTKFAGGDLVPKDQVSEVILKRLIQGVLSSPLVSDYDKSLI